MSAILAAIGFNILFTGIGIGANAAENYLRVPVQVTNKGSMPVICIAELAHWYTTVMLQAAGGKTGRAFILSDPASGALYVLNKKHTPMPVEQILCGHAGGPVTALPLLRKLGLVERPIRLTCDESGCGK